MKQFTILILILLSAVILGSCKKYETTPTLNFDYDASGGGGEGSALVNISAHVMKSVPLIDGSAKILLRRNTDQPEGIEAIINEVNSFFKLECYMPDGALEVNYCPDSIDTVADYAGSKTYKFSMTTLMGAVYHAEMYAANVYNTEGEYKTCYAGGDDPDRVGAEVVGTPNFTGGTSVYIDPTSSVWECVTAVDESGSTVYYLFTKSLDGSYYNFIVSRHQFPQESALANDVFQGYIKMSGATPQLIAFNVVNLSDYNGDGNYDAGSEMTMKTVGIVNPINNRFVVKNTTGIGAGATWLTAMGVAGFSNGAVNDGSFRVLVDGAVAYDQCLYNDPNNAFEPQEAGGDCTAVNDYFDDTDPDLYKTYLGMTADDITAMAGYVTLLDDGNTHTIAAPTASTDFASVIAQ